MYVVKPEVRLYASIYYITKSGLRYDFIQNINRLSFHHDSSILRTFLYFRDHPYITPALFSTHPLRQHKYSNKRHQNNHSLNDPSLFAEVIYGWSLKILRKRKIGYFEKYGETFDMRM